MRVYGTSPLYNYVELVFRSKRLFIASIILTTLVIVGMSSMRSSAYNARALVVLSNSKGGPDSEDAGQRGTVKYKLNLLNVVLKDPKFTENAFRDRGLDKGMTEEEFKKFSREATSAMQYGQGENILEISCRWKDARCADIIKAFYGAYSLRVLNEETVQNVSSTKMLTALAADFRNKVDQIDKKVNAWRMEHIETVSQDPNSAAIEYRARQNQVEGIEGQLALLKNQKEELARRVELEPAMIDERSVIESPRKDPEYLRLADLHSQYDEEIAKERRNHTDDHPNVKYWLDKLKDVESKEARFLGKTKDPKSGKGLTTQSSTVVNPTRLAMQDRLSDLEMQEQGYQATLEKAITERDQAKVRVRTSPEEIRKFQKLTEDLAMFTSVRDNLRAKLVQAKIDADRDRELHITEMKMMVEPEAEQEEVAKKSMMLFAAGPILGIIIAFAFSLLTETMDHSIRTPTEVEKYLGKPVLAVLPRADVPKSAQRAAISGGGENRPGISS